MAKSAELLPGTLDMLILKAVSLKPLVAKELTAEQLEYITSWETGT